jgi:hypothetical protein
LLVLVLVLVLMLALVLEKSRNYLADAPLDGA